MKPKFPTPFFQPARASFGQEWGKIMRQQHFQLQDQDKDLNGGCIYAIVCLLGFLVLFGVTGLLIAAFIYGFSHL